MKIKVCETLIVETPETAAIGNKNCDAILASPRDVQCAVLPLTGVKPRQYAGLIAEQLRARYPGRPEDSVYDYVPLAGERAAVFVCNKAVYEHMRAQNKPLIAGLLLLNAMRVAGDASERATGDSVFVLDSGNWLEIAIYKEGILQDYLICENGTEFTTLYAEIDRGASLVTFTPESLSELAKKAGIARASIFVRRSPRHTCLFAAAALLAFAVVLWTCAGRKAPPIIVHETPQEATIVHEAAVVTDSLRREQDSYGVYGILAELSSALGSSWVRAFTIQGAIFTLEAEGADSLAVLTALRYSLAFSKVTLKHASPSKICGDQFMIVGTVNRAVLSAVVGDVDNADLVAATREILGENGIQSERFSLGEKGKDAEFTLHTRAVPFLRFLRQAEESAMITALSIKNGRESGIEVKLQLRNATRSPTTASDITNNGANTKTAADEAIAELFDVPALTKAPARVVTSVRSGEAATKKNLVPVHPSMPTATPDTALAHDDTVDAGRYKMLGMVRDESGTEYVYVKDLQTNSVQKVAYMQEVQND